MTISNLNVGDLVQNKRLENEFFLILKVEEEVEGGWSCALICLYDGQASEILDQTLVYYDDILCT